MNPSQTKQKIVIKKVLSKSFRLIDANVFDAERFNEPDGDTSSSDGEQSNYKNTRKDERQFIIQFFGLNEKGETCCLYVNDFQPFFYVKVGNKWDIGDMNEFVRHLKSMVNKEFATSLVEFELVDKHKLYGFTGGKKDKFVKLVFKNTVSMNRYKSLWYTYLSKKEQEKDPESREYRRRREFIFRPDDVLKEMVLVELYESNIPPLLRYFHIHNISPSGWISFQLRSMEPMHKKTTTCTYEYTCSLDALTAMPEKETMVPYKICSFDIEASSSHGDFPLPKKDYKRLANNIADLFIKQLAYLDTAKAKMLLSKIVLTAFGFAKFEDVDLVYPKVPQSKEKVSKCIEVLCEKSVDKILAENKDPNTSKLLMLTDFFEQNKVDDTGGGCGGGDDDEEGGGGGGGGGEEEVSYVHKKKGSATGAKIEKKATIIDVLMSTTYSRDEKVQYTNKVLVLATFPELEGDKVTFIGTTFKRYGEPEPYLNHCFVLGTCDDVPGAVIQSVSTECDLLLKWAELIQNENPDIIIGYNIFGFDYEFMFRRAQENDCARDFLCLSRKIGEVCAKQDPEVGLMLENTKMQIASGEFDLRYAKMSGRVQIDLYAYFRREFNLSSYKLDDVAGEYIGDSITKVVLAEDDRFGGPVTELYSKNMMGLHVGDYIHIEITGFTSDYYKKGSKFHVLDIVKRVEGGAGSGAEANVIVIRGHENIDTTGKSLKWGTAKDDVTPQDIFRLANGSAADRAIVAKYCIQDCNLVHHLMSKIDVLTGYVEMSRICSVPISFLVFRGQGIKLTSFVAKKCRERDTLMPDLEKCGSSDGYEGAIVLPPKCAMYMDNPVACVDYASLYPSAMISQNYSHDSKVWMKEYDLAGKLIRVVGERNAKREFIYDNLPGYEYIDIEFDNFKYMRPKGKETAKAEKTKVGKIVCRWAQLPDNQKSIMPAILEELLQARASTRKLIKTEKDPFMQNILDKRQLGYKVTANSLYGQCGSKTSTFYEKDVAASTTATGRLSITYARRIIEEVYGNLLYDTVGGLGTVRTKAEYVYGDTDSVFFTFNLETPEGTPIRGKDALAITIEIAQDAANLCSQWLKAPMELAYEKTMMPFILLSKKRYVGMLYETDPKKGKLKYMGLSLKRRDSCDYLKDVYGNILNILMKGNENNIQNSIDYLNRALNELAEGKVSMDKLLITKALRSDYKNPQQIGHKVLADRIGKRDPGNKPKSGERIRFVFVNNDSPKALMGEKIETPEFILENKLVVDYTHYITNQLMKPLQQLFGLALEQIWDMQRKTAPLKAFRQEVFKLEKECDGDLELFMKKREKLCSAKVKVLLFDKVLTKIYNDKNKISLITSHFTKMAK